MNDLDLRALIPLAIVLSITGVTVRMALSEELRVERVHLKLHKGRE